MSSAAPIAQRLAAWLVTVQWPGVPPGMPDVCGDARRHRVRPADPLQRGRDLVVTQVRVIPAVGADDLELVGPAAFGPAVHNADRSPPQHHRPVQPGFITRRHCLRYGRFGADRGAADESTFRRAFALVSPDVLTRFSARGCGPGPGSPAAGWSSRSTARRSGARRAGTGRPRTLLRPGARWCRPPRAAVGAQRVSVRFLFVQTGGLDICPAAITR
jgi:hypothetical protein